MSDVITLSSVALDCPDAGTLAAFYADITAGRVTFADEAWATVDGPGGRIDFQTVPGYEPPTWPDPTSSIQAHLDFFVTDLEATAARVIAAGARKQEFQPNADHCWVFADPVGHPFCLSTWDVVGSDGGPPRPTAEIAALIATLDSQRDHVLGALDGLDEAALRRAVLPSGWSCLGLVQHLAMDVERFWFRAVVAGEPAVIAELADAGDAWLVDIDRVSRGRAGGLPPRDRRGERDHRGQAGGRPTRVVARRPVRRVAARSAPRHRAARDHGDRLPRRAPRRRP